MKIIDKSNVGPAPLPSSKNTGAVEAGERREASHTKTGDGRDSAELSGLAGKISQAAGKDSAARATKVEALRKEVASGSYHPDAAATSRGIVNDAVSQAAGAGGSPKT